MNFFVNLLKIIIVVALIGVAGVFIVMGAMVIFPSFSLFGIHYVSGDRQVACYYYDTVNDEYFSKEPGQTATETQSGQWLQTQKIFIQTDGWDVSLRAIKPTDTVYYDNGFNVSVSRNYRGFANTPISTAVFSGFEFEDRAEGKCLIMYMTEPTGLLSKTDTQVIILVNSDLLAGRDVVINTNGGTVNLGNKVVEEGGVTTEFKNLEINSKGGKVNINDIDVQNEMVINKEAGTIVANKDLTWDSVMNIKSGFGNINLKNVGSEGSSSDLTINEMYNSGIYFNNIYGSLFITAHAGYVEGNKIKGNLIVDANDCDVRVTEIDDFIRFSNKDGLLKVGTVKAGINALITSGNGGVSITSLYGQSIIQTDRGAISVNNLYSNEITAKSNSGKITLTNAKDVKINYVIEAVDSEVVLSDVNGSVIFNTLNKGRAKITASYTHLEGTNTFSTHVGNINITMLNAGYSFLLKEWNTVNKVNFKLSGFENNEINKSAESELYKNGVNIGGNTGTTNNLSLISASGMISATQVLTD